MTSIRELRDSITSGGWLNEPFKTLGELADQCQANPDSARELVIRILDQSSYLDTRYESALDDLVMQVGLYPYVRDLNALSLRGALEHAAHRAEGNMEDYVLHRSQTAVFEMLLEGRSVILSAPTSYGKSLLIDAVIAAKDFDNVVVIVPTIALIEETRRRLMRFRDKYQIVTNSGQDFEAKNIFVLTQERFLAMESDLPAPDFFVIDEFYKLARSDAGSRSTLLNRTFLDLQRSGAQFYLLGPSIKTVPREVIERLDCAFVVEDFHTVALELHFLRKRPSKIKALERVLNEQDGQTLIYCKSPASSRKVVHQLLETQGFPEVNDKELRAAADWTARNYHSEWLVSKALRHGVGIHHGRLPRALARFMVRAFEGRQISVMACTSTLIEGVNTNARNVVVYDHQIDKTRLDLFTFNNIRGRSGRMFQHFVGHVFVFEAPPEEELPMVDVPAFNPTEDTPTSLLLKMPYEELADNARARVDKVLSQDVIPRAVLERHLEVEPELMVDAGTRLVSMSQRQLMQFAWSGRPEYGQLKETSKLVWNELGGEAAGKRSGVYTADMMTFWIWELYKHRSVRRFRSRMVGNQVDRGTQPDSAVENVLAFLRNWAAFNYPRFLMALNDVANAALSKRGLPACSYGWFASAIERLFLPSSFAALEEYGLPMEISERLIKEHLFESDDTLGTVLSRLTEHDLERYADDAFEGGVIADFQAGISRS